MIHYKTIDCTEPGTIQELLKHSYKEFIDYFPIAKEKFYKQWEEEDMKAFCNQNIFGKYIFFSCMDNKPIGYFSWDDRQYPVGIIGQNCILPEYQGQGYGKKQVEIIIKIFKDKNFRQIKAVTGDHKFFIPAHKMYKSCGFKIRKKINGDLFKLVEFYRLI